MADLTWFNEARFGMFIHWGAYSVAARGEWVMNRERIPVDEYTERYAGRWKAEKYDPAAWAALAKDAGMKYVVLTTRHHDGFSLFDTRGSDFNAMRIGPRRDLVAAYAEAIRRAGLKVGLYYSPAAWAHPDYPDAFARDWPTAWKSEEHRKRFVTFYQAQVRELLTNYGRIDLLWWDGCAPGSLDGAVINEEAKRLQPHILINDRNGEPSDIATCEQEIKPNATKAWEACMTLNANWGWHAGDRHYKSVQETIEILVRTAAGGGNLLLNVGPRADGTIPEESVAILRQVGAWLKRNEAAIRNSGRSPFKWNNMTFTTVKGNRLYLHFSCDPGENYCFADLKNRVRSARLLANGQAVPFRQEGARLHLERLPVPLPDSPVTVLDLEVEGDVQAV